MLTLTKTDYGFKAVSRGALTVADLASALAEFELLHPVAGSFGYISDQRSLSLMSAEVQATVREVMRVFLSRGLDRIAIIGSSPLVAKRSNRRLSGTPAARFSLAFDGRDPRWETKAVAWVTGGASAFRAA